MGSSEGELGCIAVLLMIRHRKTPVVVRGFFSPADGGKPAVLKEAPLLCLIPLCLTALGCVVLFFFANGVYRMLLPIAGG